MATSNNGPPNKPQSLSKADLNSGGANGQCPGGLYCSTRNGAPSLNGNGNGVAKGKPLAGQVGKADNKNPPGQMRAPAGSDGNAGYECDRNHGIGRSNPAHTGCVAPAVTPPVVTPPAVAPPAVTPPAVAPPAVTPPVVLGVVAEQPQVLGVVAEQPQVLGAVAEAPVSVLGTSATANPLPAAAKAGMADTNGQLIGAGFAGLAAFLAFGAASLLRRRRGVA